MPAHKNQHFVPRCALKPFSLGGTGDAINVFNIASKRAIRNAPVKGQCARAYLYGKDLKAEQLLMTLEGNYAGIITSLNVGGIFSANDIEWLQIFILVQTRRTELAIDQIRQFGASMADSVFANAPDQRPVDDRKDSELMQESMRHAVKLLKYVKDLKVIIFHNRTNTDFVTCDNPAVLTNRFFFQRLKLSSFGISSSGTILSIPMSPRMSAICYDNSVYSVPNATGTHVVDITNTTDILSINQLQYLTASKNIYFSRWEDAGRIKSEFDSFFERRPSNTPTTTVFIRDDTANKAAVRHRDSKTGRITKYRKGTPDEQMMAKETLLMASFKHPEPTIWPSKLKFRSKPKTFYNGSGVGHVRKAEWLGPAAP